ncbi:bifunctional UDP-N-acetylglucosamine diphosphorylase/glucosamine-1-phosphate N-acetyltransferase GlmU [Microbulbifer thermotolerans]|uniref:bifunctional UDP-N-acetylglucosamine diphosphorylase/glucosamine-1-phosphate N-acetyltransferase GlmU n=1 Tax=Microbulbifer thermotolerans TaxID=252514 RepID=UPI0022489AD5|nr:bifunctional UDP-N-acetylglucosamine diphosphorylase/glucosamine-1-phosphate N-acetyltransferase GlmU [Microbulbifer thermotolerans]MCX2778550.1 bifunctional UDP-N-acetylglucosamine diphosphorylase/glucosamine-1-phosphate N-acetyltransferase GlmU [Microbulbifer thermotolerans]MCX2794034.1 bifunctional UDP-N-acetylglucosamine diphosphorylase/glucosamine-1-phosphate N-acetyltransferase GlmU [Microbulbifer thermotolerans]MCX2803941.1 bifunctional UDP-N-acetylglucosamine diphosphorylase/glucosami
MTIDVVILAAGKGTRMRSDLPKVLHPIGGVPMLGRVIDTAKQLGEVEITVVVGHGAELVRERFADSGVKFVEQKEQLGTGHAVAQAIPNFRKGSTVLVLYGDVPLVKVGTLQSLLSASDKGPALLSVEMANPAGYGRIVRDDTGRVLAIIEEKDADADTLAIREVNTGILAATSDLLARWLPELSNDNAQGEYYLTDVIARSVGENIPVTGVRASDSIEVAGVNSRAQQAQLERALQHSRALALMNAGVTLLDPARIDVRGSLECDTDVSIDINCIFEGQVVLGKGVQIGPNCLLKNCRLADGTRVEANSVIEDAEVGQACTIGPFARLRPGTQLADGAKVGNFVETKKAKIGRGSKVNHLSYIGDAIVGDQVNIGAGTITCNYDGVNKFTTEIGDGAFIGSNTALVAPVSVGVGATVGAGSTITSEVGADELAVARGRQRNITGWKRPSKKS